MGINLPVMGQLLQMSDSFWLGRTKCPIHICPKRTLTCIKTYSTHQHDNVVQVCEILITSVNKCRPANNPTRGATHQVNRFVFRFMTTKTNLSSLVQFFLAPLSPLSYNSYNSFSFGVFVVQMSE